MSELARHGLLLTMTAIAATSLLVLALGGASGMQQIVFSGGGKQAGLSSASAIALDLELKQLQTLVRTA